MKKAAVKMDWGISLWHTSIDTYAPYVYWGTVDGAEIETKIWHFVDDTALGTVC